jgi:hypothetical protein
MELVRYNNFQKDNWDLFISMSINGNFMYYRNYLDYHSERFVDHSLLAIKYGEIVAVLPAHADEEKLCSHFGLTYGGWIFGKGFSSSDFIQLFSAFEKYGADNKFKELLYKQKPSIFSPHLCETDSWVMWRNNWELFRRDLSFAIDLKMHVGYASDKRYRINKSVRNDLNIVWQGDTKIFLELVNQNLQSRYSVNAVHSLEEMLKLQTLFPDNISTITVSHNGIFLGGTWLFEDNNFVHTQYLHSNEIGKKLGAIEFLIFSLIEKYKLNKRWLIFVCFGQLQGASGYQQGKLDHEIRGTRLHRGLHI